MLLHLATKACKDLAAQADFALDDNAISYAKVDKPTWLILIAKASHLTPMLTLAPWACWQCIGSIGNC